MKIRMVSSQKAVNGLDFDFKWFTECMCAARPRIYLIKAVQNYIKVMIRRSELVIKVVKVKVKYRQESLITRDTLILSLTGNITGKTFTRYKRCRALVLRP